MLLGCIGDDFTGSSDLANTLAKRGMRVVQYCGVPGGNADATVEAGVVALKSRTIPVADAVAKSLDALDWLAAQGCRQFLFKYCSTFDSTSEGNIGPVIDALMQRLGAETTIVCPAFPAAGRSVYQGHLFVNDRLLSESGMENHPLTPMRDADLRRLLAPQTRQGVGHVAMQTVLAGPDAIRSALGREQQSGRPVIVVDAIRDEDLFAIGTAVRDLVLVTGGSGIALGLPANLLDPDTLAARRTEWCGDGGLAAILSGSCSAMTRAQVRRYRADHPALEIEAARLLAGDQTAETVADWASSAASKAAPLIYSSADPAQVNAAQTRHGRERVATAIEGFFADLARKLTEAGVTRLVVAGGETSGAVVEGLGLSALQIGPEIAPGVPAVKASDRPLWLTLKSGNFGGEDFFAEALAVLKRRPQ
ncbi:3-oxo-tetronate kinase [Aurantimonas sp. VKM B-3413]|uniref:3-oxo-tetronate kinase n=1 Tax=Aurantimonas sp. VKM B-3413 TaxID=2779401 RepID=UPI001E49AF9B|nr:3-oxo-tetronate kinase [Aurantimonas sp. VKM B-3413]MCB8836904.1 four-carbon acid sugar kinase family protein [Aurantimonas sp. VKM B-3413]